MKLISLILVCLAMASQGRVLPNEEELQAIPVTVVEYKPEQQELEQQPQALPLVKEELPKPLVEEKPADEPLKATEAEPVEDKKIEAKPEEKAEDTPAQPIVKALPAGGADADDNEKEKDPNVAPAVEENADAQNVAAGHVPHVRQVTQATPTAQQSTTQQNFVQQLIQNSPIGQFLNQFQGQQQQQQQQQVASDSPATPAPTVPGFLNPAAAITSAQQAVQNAAQSVVNSTTQAFQGIQQFASNLGNQFQNTLSGLTNPNQANAEATTPRPPGPIQSFVNNVFGGGNNASNNANPGQQQQQQQQQGPLQGIINFLGGNRPQNSPSPVPAAPITEAPPAEKPSVDDKIDPANDEIAEQQSSYSDADFNEVRSSAETGTDDSFEEAVPSNEVIVVNDDPSGVDVAPNAPDTSVPAIGLNQPQVAVAL